MEQKLSSSGWHIQRINCRVDGGLLADAQRLCAEQSITLSQLIRRGLRSELGRQETILALDLVNGGGQRVPAETIYGPDETGEGVVATAEAAQ